VLDSVNEALTAALSALGFAVTTGSPMRLRPEASDTWANIDGKWRLAALARKRYARG
jgi:hypothetical protein